MNGSEKTLKIIGGGLAGCEAAWQASLRDVDVELYEISEEGLKQVLSKEPPGLTIKEITLIDGASVQGVVGLNDIIKGQKEITSYGGWRNYLASKKL